MSMNVDSVHEKREGVDSSREGEGDHQERLAVSNNKSRYLRYARDHGLADSETNATESTATDFERSAISDLQPLPERPVRGESQPGAFGRGGNRGWMQELFNDQIEDLDSGLAEAIPVSGHFEADLETANHVSHDEAKRMSKQMSLKQSEEKLSKSAFPCPKWLLCVALTLVAVGVAATLCSVVLAAKTNVAITTPTPAASSNPTQAPSFRSSEIYIRSLLPAYTLQVLGTDSSSSSPQALALKWILDNPEIEKLPEWRILQRYSLAVFFYSMGLDTSSTWNITNADGGLPWLTRDAHECHWWARPSLAGYNPVLKKSPIEGFYTEHPNPCEIDPHKDLTLWDDGGAFKNLWLRGFSMDGTLPKEAGMLTALRSINLFQLPKDDHYAKQEKNLGGTIPSELGLCTDLEVLVLQSNSLTGSIPTTIGQLSKIFFLDIAQNRLTQTIPSELGLMTGTTSLSLAANQISGSLPSSLGEMTNLRELHLEDNDLSSTIPHQFGGLLELTELWLSANDLIGSIPFSLGGLANLGSLRFGNNSLRGIVPEELCTQLGPLTIEQMGRYSRYSGLEFDCNNELCGCDWCQCESK